MSVLIIFKYPATLNPSGNDVMNGSGGVYASFAWHKTKLAEMPAVVNIEI